MNSKNRDNMGVNHLLTCNKFKEKIIIFILILLLFAILLSAPSISQKVPFFAPSKFFNA